jgi:hypothetical protein
MKFVKPVIDEFKALIGHGFVEKYYNKVEGSTYSEEWTGMDYEKHGIKSDFIRLLRANMKFGAAYSIGFSFSYIGKTIEESSIKFSLRVQRDGDKAIYLNGKELLVREFRDSLNNVNAKISSKGEMLEYKAIFEALCEQFCPNELKKIKDDKFDTRRKRHIISSSKDLDL